MKNPSNPKQRVTLSLDLELASQARTFADQREASLSAFVEALIREEVDRRRASIDRLFEGGELRDPPRGEDPLFDAMAERHAPEQAG